MINNNKVLPDKIYKQHDGDHSNDSKLDLNEVLDKTVWNVDLHNERNVRHDDSWQQYAKIPKDK